MTSTEILPNALFEQNRNTEVLVIIFSVHNARETILEQLIARLI